MISEKFSLIKKIIKFLKNSAQEIPLNARIMMILTFWFLLFFSRSLTEASKFTECPNFMALHFISYHIDLKSNENGRMGDDDGGEKNC